MNIEKRRAEIAARKAEIRKLIEGDSEVIIFLCSSARIRNFGALSRAALWEHFARENLLPADGELPCCNAEAPHLDLEVQVFRALNTHS